jgi:hypothetical protein
MCSTISKCRYQITSLKPVNEYLAILHSHLPELLLERLKKRLVQALRP